MRCRVPIAERCPLCQGQISWLFDFSSVPWKVFGTDRERAPRKVLGCLSCACFAPVFSQYFADGTARWHPATTLSNPSRFEAPCEYVCHLNLKAFPPFAAQSSGLEDATTLGGIPMWQQDAEYPLCPDCSNPMRFLAQFDNLARPTPEEGTYYSFFCAGCQTAAVTYQQT